MVHQSQVHPIIYHECTATNKGINPLLLTSELDGRWVVNATPPAASPPEITWYPLNRRLHAARPILTAAVNLAPQRLDPRTIQTVVSRKKYKPNVCAHFACVQQSMQQSWQYSVRVHYTPEVPIYTFLPFPICTRFQNTVHTAWQT